MSDEVQTSDLLVEGDDSALNEPSNEGKQVADGSGAGTALDKGTKQIPALHQQFPKELQGHESLMGFEKAGQLATSYVELKKSQGASIKLPGESATDDERAAFVEKVSPFMGRPETQDDYKFDDVSLPEGMEDFKDMWSQYGDMSYFAEIAYKNGLSQEAANNVQMAIKEANGAVLKSFVDGYVSHVNQDLAAEERDLKREWGNEYPQKKELANRAVSQFGSEKFIEIIKAAKVNGRSLNSHPEMRRFFATIGDSMLEGKTPKNEPGVTLKKDTAYPDLQKYYKERGQDFVEQ